MSWRPLCSCIYCKSIITANNLKNHCKSKQCNSGGKYIPKFSDIPENFVCIKCGTHCYGEISYINHYNKCSGSFKQLRKLPIGKSNNQYTKAKELGIPLPIVSDKTRHLMSERAKNNSQWTVERRESHSITMREVAKNNPISYNSSNRGRVKEIQKYGINFHGSWELKFYEWCLNNSIQIERNYTGFQYVYEGVRTYYPDFYLPCYDFYVEVKGYKVDKDVFKWSFFNKNLIVIQKYEIRLIDSGEFELGIATDCI